MEEVLTCGNCGGQFFYVYSGGFKCPQCNHRIIISETIIDVTKLNKDQDKINENHK